MIELYLLLFFSFVYLFLKRATKSKYKLPPGPWFKIPLLGHIPFLGANPHITLTEWSATYGPVISIQLGSFPTVIINDGKILKQAFSSSALAGRPKIKLLDDWSRRKGFSFTDGPHARELRRFALKTLRDLTKTSDSMESRILDETTDLVASLDKAEGKPMSVHEFFSRNVINALLGVLMSKRYEADDEELARVNHDLASAAQNSGFLAVLGMYVPFLCSWFPNAVGYTLFLESGNAAREFFRPFFQQHSATLTPGQPRDVMDIYLEKVNESKDDAGSSFHDFRNIEDTFRELLTGGMETTSSQLEWITHYMAKYPSVQAKLIAEIDSKLPSDRLPSLSDRPELPYAEAVVQEALRISTIGPFGLFHSALEDTEIAGYTIPKDTLVIGNLYAVNNDPTVWDSPKEFRPERFINPDGKFTLGEDPVIPFGTGQRSCIGEQLARNELFLFTVRIFQNFRVKAASELPDDHNFAIAVAPVPFQVIFERRHPQTNI